MRDRRARAGIAVGALLVATSVGMVAWSTPASAHTPSASITCTSWSISATNYEPQQNNTFSVSIDSGTPITGSFATSFSRSGTFAAGSGDHTLVGYVYQNNNRHAQYSQTYNLHTSGCVTYVPVPGAPSASQPTCEHGGVLTVEPAGDHVKVSGGHTGDGPGTYTIKYKTDNGYTFPDGSTTKSYDITVLPKLTGDICKTEVSPVGPTSVTQPGCDGITPVPGSFAAPPNGGGITYSVSGNVITATITDPATHKWGALNGYTKISDTTATYTVHYNDPPTCPHGATPAAPTLTQSQCDGPGSHSQAVLHITAAPGVVYKIDGSVVTGDINEAPGTVLDVVATPADGYLFIGEQTVTYHVSFSDPGDCLVLVTPEAPTPTDGACTTPGHHSDATLVIPNTPHVIYKINGVGADVSGQTLSEPVGSSLDVVASPAEGYKFDGPQTVTYPVGFADPGDCLVVVTPVAPAISQAVCDGPGTHSSASIEIPTVTGVIYLIGEQVVSGTVPVSSPGTVVVTAIPADGYVFSEESTHSWLEEFSDVGDCLVGTEVVAPSFTDDVCSDGQAAGTATFTIPESEHVSYTIDGETVSAGTYPATDGATVTVIAVADEGYQLIGDGTFTHTFAVPQCAKTVVPTPATFVSNVCTSQGDLAGASYTIPETTGVEYRVDGDVVPAGTYAAVDGSTITVVADALDGYLLSGATQWSYTFGATPECLGTAGQSSGPTGHGTGGTSTGGETALTGAPVAGLLFAGLALLLAGGASMALARKRRGGTAAM